MTAALAPLKYAPFLIGILFSTLVITSNATKVPKLKSHGDYAHFDFGRLVDSKPPVAPISFDCKVRELAYKYANQLQPWRTNLDTIYDALELKTRCNSTIERPISKPYQPPTYPIPKANTFYVDAVKGSDSNDGTISSPFRTIEKAVKTSRYDGGPSTILLREGTFYLDHTIHVGPEDSHLTISNYNGETVYVSGGKELKTDWKPYNVSNNPTIEVYHNQNNIYGRAVNGGDTDTIKYIGDFNSTEECLKACVNFNRGGLVCRSFTYHTATYNDSAWSRQCYAVVDFTWGPTPEQHINSGRISQMNVYVAELKGQGVKEMLGLQQMNGGKRADRARYPNADTELAQYPEGWVLNTKKWFPPKKYETAVTVSSEPVRTDITMFQQYTMGIGGPCEIFTPPVSYWCSANCSGGGASVFETPTGLVYPDSTFLQNDQNWKDTPKAVMHVWHPYHWAMWMYYLDSHDPKTHTLRWSYGGFQGARGAGAGNGRGGEWYIENVFEMLDTPNEFYYDEEQELLYYFYNDTGAPPDDFKLVATNLKTLISVMGSQSDPVRNITLQGINFVTAAKTFMDPHGVPSGGDWAMQRSAALFFEGTEHLTIDGCLFQRLDGNGLILSGYNRHATIQNSEFAWIGESPMVAWGYSQEIDGTDGNQPRFTTVQNNLAREFGHYQKQASPWFQAIACQTTLKNNIMFNGPRALINFNDGFGGGNVIANNLLFNPNRETSDQGPFNSWDRIPFLTDVLYGKTKPSLTPAYNDIHHNFMICNYGSNMCIDNDDGSSYYLNRHNFEVYGGHKSDFGGHNKFTSHAILAYAQDYQQGLCGDFNNMVPGYVDGFDNNRCIQGTPVPYITMDLCDPKKPNPSVIPLVFNNTVYNSAGNTRVVCGQTTISEDEWQKMGFDTGTVVKPIPDDDEVISWAVELLGIKV